MVVRSCNLSTQVVEAGGLLQVRGHLGLHREFQPSQGYAVNPVSETVMSGCHSNARCPTSSFSVLSLSCQSISQTDRLQSGYLAGLADAGQLQHLLFYRPFLGLCILFQRTLVNGHASLTSNPKPHRALPPAIHILRGKLGNSPTPMPIWKYPHFLPLLQAKSRGTLPWS